MSTKEKAIELYLDARTGEISDHHGNAFTLDAAKRLAETQEYRCNMAFQFLVDNDFDLDKTLNDFTR